MDDEPMWTADRVIASTHGFAITIPESVNEFTIKDSKVPLILGRPFLHTADAVIRVKQKQINLGVGTERMIFNNDSTMKHSYLNNDTCFSIDIIDEILEEDFDALLDKGSKILHCIKGTLLEEEIFTEFDEFMEMTAYENSKSKKGGITVVTNENDELVRTRTLQVGECFQIPIDPNDQEKTTFTCPFETYAYRRMPFGLSNALATFQRCVLAIFLDMIKESVEVFMDDFFVFGDSFDKCLNNLDKMLQCCKDSHLVLNWEKCHFMVKEGIMIGHKMSGTGLEIDKAKIDTISNFHPY
nr:reverse transcriptase domain-containing protein [Tanacetum cinerariifolium]